jgi:uncharacterized protein (TIGR03084 family)
MPTMDEICRDLVAEHDDLDAIVAALDEAGWDTATPAEGWSIRDSLSHLLYFDRAAGHAVADPDDFRVWAKDALRAMRPDAGDAPDVALGRAMSGTELLTTWRTDRATLTASLRDLDPKARVPWFGPDMSAASFATARLMETWAHGQDVADTLGAQRAPSERLRHICHIGIRALPYAYSVRGMAVPEVPIRVEVTAPSGEVWTWGPEDAPDVVRGSALGLALVVTQRRHPADTDVQTTGPVAAEWISIAQAFAGPAGPGRPAGMFERS